MGRYTIHTANSTIYRFKFITVFFSRSDVFAICSEMGSGSFYSVIKCVSPIRCTDASCLLITIAILNIANRLPNYDKTQT